MNARWSRTFDVEHRQEKENRQQNGQPDEEEKDEQNLHEQMHSDWFQWRRAALSILFDATFS